MECESVRDGEVENKEKTQVRFIQGLQKVKEPPVKVGKGLNDSGR